MALVDDVEGGGGLKEGRPEAPDPSGRRAPVDEAEQGILGLWIDGADQQFNVASRLHVNQSALLRALELDPQTLRDEIQSQSITSSVRKENSAYE